jgi:hypothetical protein
MTDPTLQALPTAVRQLSDLATGLKTGRSQVSTLDLGPWNISLSEKPEASLKIQFSLAAPAAAPFPVDFAATRQIIVAQQVGLYAASRALITKLKTELDTLGNATGQMAKGPPAADAPHPLLKTEEFLSRDGQSVASFQHQLMAVIQNSSQVQSLVDQDIESEQSRLSAKINQSGLDPKNAQHQFNTFSELIRTAVSSRGKILSDLHNSVTSAGGNIQKIIQVLSTYRAQGSPENNVAKGNLSEGTNSDWQQINASLQPVLKNTITSFTDLMDK